MAETIEISPTDLGNWFFPLVPGGYTPTPDFLANPTTGTHAGKLGVFFVSSGGNTYYAAVWFRFAIPFATDEITISRVRIKYQKYESVPHFADLEHVGILGQDSDYPTAPTSVSDIDTILLGASGRTTEEGVGEFVAPGTILYHQDTDGFDNFANTAVGEPVGNEGLNDIMSRMDWAADNHIFVALRPNGSTATGVKMHIGGTPSGFPGGYTIEYPKLVLEFEYNTPAPADYDAACEHTLTIEHDITVINMTKHVVDDLTIEQDIAFDRDHGRSLEHELEIISEVHVPQTYSLEVEHIVIPMPTQTANLVHPLIVEHTILIEQDITVNGPLFKQVKQELEIEQDLDYDRDYNRTVESELDIEHSISQTGKHRYVTHAIGITQDIDVEGPFGTSNHVNSTIVITQDIDYNANRTRGVEHTLVIGHSILGYGPNGTSLCNRKDLNYAPAADAQIDFPAKPTLGTNALITLTLASPSTTLLLPVPLMGDREELKLTRIQRKTRGGVLKTFSDAIWPKVRTFRYKFDGLDTDKVIEVMTFFGLSLGLKITLTDHENRQWEGYIVNPQGESAQYFRQCGSTTEFDFDGVEI